MGKNKLKIGEFSRLGRVTVRALRHYEEIGLLVPEIVDRDLWDDESHFPSVESLEQKILACEEELAPAPIQPGQEKGKAPGTLMSILSP